MSQKTLVLKVPRSGHAALAQRFASSEFEARSVPHAVFSVKGAGCVATLYRSGKLVVQGAEPELFLARFTDLEADAAPAKSAATSSRGALHIAGPLVGSDEAGKGDYFGPLVVAAVRLEEEEAAALSSSGIADSKTLTDERALMLAAGMRARVRHAIVRLDPEEYNREYPEHKSLNPMLAGLHARAIREIARDGDAVLVDQFGPERLMRDALRGDDLRLHQATRAERNIAVAAASVLARAEFLLGLRELSEEFGIDLHKGAGAPTDRSALAFGKSHGSDLLSRVAKMHFKNTQKVRAQLE